MLWLPPRTTWTCLGRTLNPTGVPSAVAATSSQSYGHLLESRNILLLSSRQRRFGGSRSILHHSSPSVVVYSLVLILSRALTHFPTRGRPFFMHAKHFASSRHLHVFCSDIIKTSKCRFTRLTELFLDLLMSRSKFENEDTVDTALREKGVYHNRRICNSSRAPSSREIFMQPKSKVLNSLH
jgi:hypothetical protein